MKNALCFVGSHGQFSLVALRTLLEQKINISQIILSGFAPAIPASKALPVSPFSLTPSSTSSPIENTPGIPALAAQHDIPVYYVGGEIRDFPSWKNFPHDTPPEFLFVACFPFRLPSALRQWPKKWAINLHPSLLPRYRGPDPIFWQLHHNETETGFSLHLLEETLDTGAILLQKPARFPQGASRNDLDTLLAEQGTEALYDVINSAPHSPLSKLKPREQDNNAASYQSLPHTKDFVLETSWSAEHAYNFIRGTQSPRSGYPVLLDGQLLHIADAAGFETQHSLGKDFLRIDNEIHLQFSPGVLHAKPV